MSSTFPDLGVRADLVAILAARGITDPRPVQALAVPPALDGRDVCGRAPTGSGKTLAFGLPLAHRVVPAGPRRPTALVLAPTRELAAQIRSELAPLLRPAGRTVAAFYGGVGFGDQRRSLRQGVDVAVACPGRLADLVGQGEVDLSDVGVVVVDEADRMAEMGFLPEVRRLLDRVRPDRQTLLFSATLDGDVDVLVRRYQRQPVVVDVAAAKAELDRTVHQFVDTQREQRVALAARLVGEHGQTVVFCRTKRGADRVARQLQAAGVSAVPIHGGRSQSQRDRALSAFAAGSAAALVATDVAARGIHVDGVRCVVHFDLAADAKDYVHRSGRTGRAGASGTVVSFVTETDRDHAGLLRRALDLTGAGSARRDHSPATRAARPAPASAGAGRGVGRPAPAAAPVGRGGGRSRRRRAG